MQAVPRTRKRRSGVSQLLLMEKGDILV